MQLYFQFLNKFCIDHFVLLHCSVHIVGHTVVLCCYNAIFCIGNDTLFSILTAASGYIYLRCDVILIKCIPYCIHYMLSYENLLKMPNKIIGSTEQSSRSFEWFQGSDYQCILICFLFNSIIDQQNITVELNTSNFDLNQIT